jgi:peptidoglycan LD-endopeptidase LytH
MRRSSCRAGCAFGHHGTVDVVNRWVGGLATLLLMAGGCFASLTGCSSRSPGSGGASSATTTSDVSATGSATVLPGSSAEASSRSPAAAPGGSASGVTAARYVFPVKGNANYERTHHDYPATDIMANCGLPVVAATDGVVLELSRVDRFDKNNPKGEDKGGLFVAILGNDGVRYYGAHLSSIGSDINPGVRVTAGQQLGRVGSTGNSGACHLHFAISPPCAGTADWWIRRGVIYPWRYLDAWRAGNSLSPVSEVGTWLQEHGCATSAPDNA